MSKVFGLVLLGGLALIVLVSLALLTWVWIRSANELPTKPTPTKSAYIIKPEVVENALVVVRGHGSGVAGRGLEVEDYAFRDIWAVSYQSSGLNDGAACG